MKFLLLLALVTVGVLSFGTRGNTPFLRLGLLLTLAGVWLFAATSLFASRSIIFGAVLVAAGVACYAFGRVRRETFSFTRPSK